MVSWIQLFKLRRFSQKVVENNLDSLQENIGYKIGCPCMAFNWEIFPFVFTHTHTHTHTTTTTTTRGFRTHKTLTMNIRNCIKILLHLQGYTVWLNKDFITSSKLHRLTEQRFYYIFKTTQFDWTKILLHLQSYTIWLNKDFITSSKLHSLTEQRFYYIFKGTPFDRPNCSSNKHSMSWIWGWHA